MRKQIKTMSGLGILMFAASLVAQDHSQHQMGTSGNPEMNMDSSVEKQSASKGPEMTLQELESLALKNNPTLTQAEASVRAAQGRKLQAGLWSNPTVGYSGEEIRGGALRGGQHGAFIEQTIPISGRLGLSRNLAQSDVKLAELVSDQQQQRVLTGVRIAFYRVLAAQELLAQERAFADLAAKTADTARRLRNVGQSDETEVLQAEIEAEQSQLAVARQQNEVERLWSELATTVGRPELPLASVAGKLESNLPEIDESKFAQTFVAENPLVQSAEANHVRAEAALGRARREWAPDLQVRAGVQQNRELLEGTGRPVGTQGFAEVGIQLPIFNRNQGGVQAAQAEVLQAKAEQERVRLQLQQRAANLLESYRNARLTVDRYRKELLPRAERSYTLMTQRWGQMGVSYPQLLLTQRTLFQVRADYTRALEELWTSGLALQGFGLTGALESVGANSSVRAD